MQIEQKQNRIYKPQSVYTYAAEECNQVSTELENVITEGGLTPNANDVTQVKTAISNMIDVVGNDLQEQIDAITASSDVFDVVGTYAQLQAYDKTTVPINDIIKVLQDESRDDAMTYYRLVETSGATEWIFIGAEGPFYTVSETDSIFATKAQLPSQATEQQLGLVKPDNSSILISQDGTLSASGNVAAALPLFTPIWSDHLMNNVSYLRGDTFSWQSGSVYTAGYQELLSEYNNASSETETEGSITFKRTPKGYKIADATQEQAILDLYNNTGVAMYYILDTTNTRFKLPRTKYGFVGIRDGVGNYVSESLPDHTHLEFGIENGYGDIDDSSTPNRRSNGSAGNWEYRIQKTADEPTLGKSSKAKGSSAYQDNAPVQQRATQMYLYFYVGNYTQPAIEQTAGLNTELFNDKVDLDGNNATFPHIVETYSNGTEWYRVWSDGWCEQGGYFYNNSATINTITFMKPYSNTPIVLRQNLANGVDEQASVGKTCINTIGTTSFTARTYNRNDVNNFYWIAKGYIEEEE